MTPRAESIIATLNAVPRVLHEYLLDKSVYRIVTMLAGKSVTVVAYVLRGDKVSIMGTGAELNAAMIDLVKKLEEIN